jgi:hypothetical protein
MPHVRWYTDALCVRVRHVPREGAGTRPAPHRQQPVAPGRAWASTEDGGGGMIPRCTGTGCDHVLCIEHRRVLEALEQAELERDRLRETLAAVRLAAQWNPWNTTADYDINNDPRD